MIVVLVGKSIIAYIWFPCQFVISWLDVMVYLYTVELCL